MQSHRTTREHQWSFAKETHSIFGKEIRLVKNKQHKTAPKREEKVKPLQKEGNNKSFFNKEIRHDL